MKKLLLLLRPFIIYIAVIMGFFFAQSKFLDEVLSLFRLQDASSINIINNIFAIVFAVIMLVSSYFFAREVSGRHGRILTFSVNLICISSFAIFLVTSCALCWK